MPKRFYPAVVERDEGGLFAAWFPDFPGAVAAAPSQEAALAKAQEALTRALQDLAERDLPPPAPTPLEAIKVPAGTDLVGLVALGASPPDPSERVNVYLPGSLIARADELAADWGVTRSSLFGLALTRLLSAPGGWFVGPAATRRKR
jgi:predicted RNase H-like HicB family nuclease